MTLLAKPSGVPLATHRQNVHDEAMTLVEAMPFLAAKYARLLPGRDLRRVVRRAAWHHDDGKEHRRWQDACQADYAEYRAWRIARGLDPDAIVAADYARYESHLRRQKKKPGQHLMKARLRHEFASLWLCERRGIALDVPERVAIAAHHAKLNARHEKRWLTDDGGTFKPFWEALCRFSGNYARGEHDEADQRLLVRYETAAVRALLRLADTRASRREAGREAPDIVPFCYTFPHGSELRPVQQLALDCADDPVTILRAPTGSGKTDGAFLWGRHQIERGRADRLVLAMPTRFTSNALAVNVAESVSDTGLYHSSAWHARFGHQAMSAAERDLARERHRLARLLATPVTVCTIDHLLIALTGTHEDHHATFFFLANAAVVFDEVDFYDPFVQSNLVVLLDVLRRLDVPVLLMSATVPESSRTLYRVPREIAETQAAEGGQRVVRRHAPVERPEDAAGVLREMLTAGTGIVYANTVERAYRYYLWLTEEAKRQPNAPPVLLYHSRFIEPHKKVIEGRLIGALGRKAWREGRAHGVAVLTQIGEMSVNVSAPLMLADLCPWDRLAQRMGRLNRFGEAERGVFHVTDPHREGALYPAPYGSFDSHRGWTPGVPLVETGARLDALFEAAGSETISLTAPDLVREVNALYPATPDFDATARANVAELRRMLRENWMVVPRAEADEDTGELTARWKSRDIEPQITLVVRLPEEADSNAPDRDAFPFGSYEVLREFLLEWGVSCPTYLAKRGEQSGRLSPFPYTVGDDAEVRVLHYYRGYDEVEEPRTGLAFLSLREQEDDFTSRTV